MTTPSPVGQDALREALLDLDELMREVNHQYSVRDDYQDRTETDRLAEIMATKLRAALTSRAGARACPWARSSMTPCVIKDGAMCYAEDGHCVGCGSDRVAIAALTSRAGESVADAALAEVARSTAKYPTWPTDPLHALAVLGEEFGELTKAALQSVYEPHKSTPADVREEAVQTAAMALRFLASLDRYEYTRGAQHAQGAGPTSGAPE